MAINFFQQVATWNPSGLALLLNMNCAIANANTKFKHFNKDFVANLGDTITFDKPPQMITASGLVASFQGTNQRTQSLTVDQSENVAYEFTAQDWIFNAEQYMDKYGRSAIAALSTSVETNILENAVSNTYRFYGDGTTPIDSFDKLAQALAIFRNYGVPKGRVTGFLSDIAESDIITSGLNQFTPKRNDEIAQSWEVGSFSNTDWCRSNLLPVHTAGTVGESASTLTVTGVTKDAFGAIEAITFSGAGTDVNAIKKYDKFQIQNKVNYLIWTGTAPSASPVQFRATADAESSAGSVTVSIFPKLQVAAGRDQNLTTDIIAGMTASVLPSHRAGLLMAGNPLFLAMPALPEEVPYPTSVISDDDSGVAIRQYYGSRFGENQRGMVNDCAWGSTLADEYAMELVFPLY